MKKYKPLLGLLLVVVLLALAAGSGVYTALLAKENIDLQSKNDAQAQEIIELKVQLGLKDAEINTLDMDLAECQAETDRLNDQLKDLSALEQQALELKEKLSPAFDIFGTFGQETWEVTKEFWLFLKEYSEGE